MSCCGKGRTLAPEPRPSSIETSGPPPAQPRQRLAYFQYTGRTGVTVRGPATGHTYRFGYHGAIVGIDPGDAGAVAGVPALQRVAGP